MEQAFELIVNNLYEELKGQGFAPAAALEDPNGPAVLFTTESVAYSVLYEEAGKKFLLRSAPMLEGKPDKWKVISTWLYEEDNGATLADAQSIAADFVETVAGPSHVAAVQSAIRQQKKKKSADDENYVEPQFFYNRLAAIYPSLKEAMNQERITYGQVRFIAVARQTVLPLMQQTLQAKGESVEKLGRLIGDTYEHADKDTRSIITAVLINGLSDEEVALLEPYFGDTLKPLYVYSRKYKNANIQPEKEKKKSRIVAKSLGE